MIISCPKCGFYKTKVVSECLGELIWRCQKCEEFFIPETNKEIIYYAVLLEKIDELLMNNFRDELIIDEIRHIFQEYGYQSVKRLRKEVTE
jgi:uncharacterized Zn finger protein